MLACEWVCVLKSAVMKNAITPTREENFPEWYQQVVKAAELAQHSPVRGCMVVLPWGYRMWEKMVAMMDSRFRKKGVENAYFPLFIPLSYFQKEADHVEGFATECAVVTHHRLKKDSEGNLQPEGELEEPLVVRPTSEMIIGEMFAQWIESYRDLPMKVNQWCNVVRWEMRTRLFLRTAEFLWQEGHCAFATREEAEENALEHLELYRAFCHDVLALPVVTGEKSEAERFPGAENTHCIEMLMQDGKALQCGTSHFLGQRFAKAANMQYQGDEGLEYCWTTSWGSTTRLVGAMIMTHGDDDGMVMPPRCASAQIVIIPIAHKEESKAAVMEYCEQLKADLERVPYYEGHLEVKIDARDVRGGEKSWHWIKKGAPMRVEVGPRDIEKGGACVAMRHLGPKEKRFPSREELIAKAPEWLDEMQNALYERAKERQEGAIKDVSSRDEFDAHWKSGGTGFLRAPWAGDMALEKAIQQEHSVTIRCLQSGSGTCPFTQQAAEAVALFALSY